MKRIILYLLILLVLLAAYILYNTFTFSARAMEVRPLQPEDIPATAAQHLAESIKIPTVSYGEDQPIDSSAFYGFHQFVKDTYPLTDSLLNPTFINKLSMVFEWKGSDPGLKPIILLGHFDVVPVVDEDLDKWSYDPFGGTITDGIIWGRGAIDDKVSVIGNLEAAELLLNQGFQPRRTVYFCFGHDEEIGGMEGAVKIVEFLKERGVEAEFVLDEGMAVTEGMVPGVEGDVGLIGTAEKGFITLELSIDITGGHSSMPARESAIDILARAVVKLKDQPFEPEITDPVEQFLLTLGPDMPFSTRMAIANQWLFGNMIMDQLSKEPSGNALIRTTTAPTIFKSGVKDNVIPYSASATVNFRTLPGTSSEDVIQHVKKVIADERIAIRQGPFNSEAPKSSSASGNSYRIIEETIHQIFPGVRTAPNLVVGATDSRYYYPVSDDVYRFTPIRLNPETMKTFHGVDERIPVKDFNNAVRYYAQLIRNGAGG